MFAISLFGQSFDFFLYISHSGPMINLQVYDNITTLSLIFSSGWITRFSKITRAWPQAYMDISSNGC